MRVQNCEVVLRLLVLGGAIAIAMATSVGVKAADLAYPPPIAGPPQYGEVAPPTIVPPQVIVVPGPTAIPQYSGAPLPPPVVGPSYAVPPLAVGVGVAPRRPCAPDSRCGVCGWQAGCTPYPERYPAPYESLGPQVYPGLQSPSAAEPYSSQYAPRVYSGPIGPYASDRGPYRP